ncbi:NADH-quinone oxidoreductase subunit N [Oligoflexia bacterium]|nr:NADH-quinone oxidoreductase subunit N [Oligoflexia bacterium]
MDFQSLISDCGAILPELLLSAVACLVILVDMVFPFSLSRKICGLTALVGIVIAIILVVAGLGEESRVYFSGLIVNDHLASVFKLIFLFGAGITVVCSLRSTEICGYRLGEYFSLLLGAVVGACLLVSSNNFIFFIIALDTLSICSYVLAGYVKHDRFSAEAALKFVLYGAVATGVMLFGIGYFYGLTGTVDIRNCMLVLAAKAASGQDGIVVLLSFLFVLVGLGYKVAMVPFHFWCPDVYQGSPTPITAFFSVVSKAAGFGALMRLLAPVFGLEVLHSSSVVLGALPVLFGVLAMITMTYGNLAALRQTNVKRLLAYSSIAHAGYLLMGFAVFTPEALEAVAMYLTVFLFMNFGAFWVVILLINQLGGAELERFKGVAYKAPLIFGVMFLCLISLTGLPPTAGFAAKLVLFKVVIGAGISTMDQGLLTGTAGFYFLLALLGVLNSVVSLYYYMKIVKVMVFERPDEGFTFTVSIRDGVFAVVVAAPVLLFLYFGPLIEFVKGIA